MDLDSVEVVEPYLLLPTEVADIVDELHDHYAKAIDRLFQKVVEDA